MMKFEYDLGNGKSIIVNEHLVKILIAAKISLMAVIDENLDEELEINLRSLKNDALLADINNFLLYFTVDALDGKIHPNIFDETISTMIVVAGIIVEGASDIPSLKAGALTVGMLSGLRQLVILKRGDDNSLTMVDELGMEIIPEHDDREKWAESFIKTLEKIKKMERRRYKK